MRKVGQIGLIESRSELDPNRKKKKMLDKAHRDARRSGAFIRGHIGDPTVLSHQD